MRVTGGELKGRQILSGFANHVRPSTDRVRESLFNSLQNQLEFSEIHVLDLFSGSGIIALEFLSRYAISVTSIDIDKKNTLYQKNIRQEWQIPSSTLIQNQQRNPTSMGETTKYNPSNAKVDQNYLQLHKTNPLTSAPLLGNWDIITADVWKLIPTLKVQYDVIFADPPYHMPNLQQLSQWLLPHLNPKNPNSLLLIEHKPQIQFPIAPINTKDYGSSIISFFKP